MNCYTLYLIQSIFLYKETRNNNYQNCNVLVKQLGQFSYFGSQKCFNLALLKAKMI